ncbi:MAG: hypothetical protein WC052_03315 [Patescibacteria group bacterium]|jgi:hypothetical protein
MSEHGGGHGESHGLFGKLAIAAGVAIAFASLVAWATGCSFTNVFVPIMAIAFITVVAAAFIRLPQRASRHYPGSAGWWKRLLMFVGTGFALAAIVSLRNNATASEAELLSFWNVQVAVAITAMSAWAMFEFWHQHGYRLAGAVMFGVVNSMLITLMLIGWFPLTMLETAGWRPVTDASTADIVRVDDEGVGISFTQRKLWRGRLQDGLDTAIKDSETRLKDGKIGTKEALDIQTRALKDYKEGISKMEAELRLAPPLSERVSGKVKEVLSALRSTPQKPAVSNRPDGVPENAVRFVLEPGEDWCPTEKTKLGIKGEDGREYAFVDVSTGHAPTVLDGSDHSGIWPYCIRGGELGAAIWVWPRSS